jgi:hypothetical protein
MGSMPHENPFTADEIQEVNDAIQGIQALAARFTKEQR